MFGDKFRRPSDSMDLIGKYNGYNLNQSMFQRFVNANQCVLNLKNTHRFCESVLRMNNHLFYNKTLHSVYHRKDEFKGFVLFHRYNDNCMFELVNRIMQFAPPTKHTYTIVSPPNIGTNEMRTELG